MLPPRWKGVENGAPPLPAAEVWSSTAASSLASPAARAGLAEAAAPGGGGDATAPVGATPNGAAGSVVLPSAVVASFDRGWEASAKDTQLGRPPGPNAGLGSATVPGRSPPTSGTTVAVVGANVPTSPETKPLARRTSAETGRGTGTGDGRGTAPSFASDCTTAARPVLTTRLTAVTGRTGCGAGGVATGSAGCADGTVLRTSAATRRAALTPVLTELPSSRREPPTDTTGRAVGRLGAAGTAAAGPQQVAAETRDTGLTRLAEANPGKASSAITASAAAPPTRISPAKRPNVTPCSPGRLDASGLLFNQEDSW
jgi:hypothetical protein